MIPKYNVEYTVDLGRHAHTSHYTTDDPVACEQFLTELLERGHRIRITIASTGAPFYEANPNTDGPLTIEPPTKTQVARNTVQHHRKYASRIVAPVRIIRRLPFFVR